MTVGPTTAHDQILSSKLTMAVTHHWQLGGKVREAGSPQGGLIAQQGKQICHPIITLSNQNTGDP